MTSTGVPTRDTWKLTDESVWDTSVTVVVPACLTGGSVSPIDVRGHEAGPLCASSTSQRPGWSYQESAGWSQLDGAGFTPLSTAGSFASGVTSGASLTR